jgi:hypothetical protein
VQHRAKIAVRRLTRRWSKGDSNLYGAFPVK